MRHCVSGRVTGMGLMAGAVDAEEQFTQLFDSITLVLTEARLTWNDVIEMTSWHTDMAELSIFQQVRDRWSSSRGRRGRQ